MVVLLLGVFTTVQAQTKDVITFAGGHVDPDNENIYVIDLAPENLIDDEDVGPCARVTFQRPLGASATREASITVMEAIGWSDEITVTFAPHETEKTVDIELRTFEKGRSNGTAVVPINVLWTNHADAQYEMLQLNIPNTMEGEIPTCSFTGQQKLREWLAENGSHSIYYQRWGNYIVFTVFFDNNYVEVDENSTILLETRYTKHEGLSTDADDAMLSKTREVLLKPVNVGEVTNQIIYYYQPSDDEYLASLIDESVPYSPIDNTDHGNNGYRGVPYRLLEAGPYKVARPAEGGLTTLFLPRSDMEQGGNYRVAISPDRIMPLFSDVGINKTTFKSGETMVITAKMDNWHLVKRARYEYFMSAFGVTLDNGVTTEPYRYTLDETTGMVTYFVTAPTVSEETSLNVDFGPIANMNIYDEDGYTGYTADKVLAGSDGQFTVTVTDEPADPQYATQIDFVNMPADGAELSLGSSFFSDYDAQEFSLAISAIPLDANDLGTVVYSVENVVEAGTDISPNAEIKYDKQGLPLLNTGIWEGTIIVKATLGSGVSVARTYYLVRTPGKKLNHANTYLAGTTFPEFRFELSNMSQLDHTWDWTGVGDKSVTVKYTHANGKTRTEQYDFDKMTYHTHYYEGTNIHWTREYVLPFSFTDDFPNATVDQIGQVLVTAEITMKLKNSENRTITAISTATLTPRLKDLSFGDYYEAEEHFHYKKQPTLTSEVMYLPTKGFTVGYEIPELNLRETYNSQEDGDNVPAWLEIQKGDLYTTAYLTVQPTLDRTQNYNLTLYTLAQRSYDPDEAMQRDLTCQVSFSPVSPEGHMAYRVNGQNVNSDLTFDNGPAVAAVVNKLKSSGFVPYGDNEDINTLMDGTKAFFTIFDDVFDGADVTLTCEDETIQELKSFKGTFTFMPPSDGRTYQVTVYYPGYDKRYTNTFVNHKLTSIHTVGLVIDTEWFYQGWDGTQWIPKPHNVDYSLEYYNDGQKFSIPYPQNNSNAYTMNTRDGLWQPSINGFIYIDDPVEIFVKGGESTVRLPFPEEFKQLDCTIKPELRIDNDNFLFWSYDNVENADNNYAANLRYYYPFPSYGGYEHMRFFPNHRQVIEQIEVNWREVTSQNTLVTVVNSQGEPITNAKLNYACVNGSKEIQGEADEATYNSTLEGYQLKSTDPHQYALFIEVEAPGYQTVLTTMYLWNYNYYLPQNRGKVRRHTIVLTENTEQVNSASLETLARNGNLKDNEMNAKIVTTDLLITDKDETINYTQNGDYETVVKHVSDEKLGRDGWDGTKYANLSFIIPYEGTFDAEQMKSQLRLEDGSLQITPENVVLLTKDDFTTFSQNYCFADFNIVDQIAVNTTMKPVLKNGTQTVMALPSLHNHTVDLMALNEANNIQLDLNGTDLTKVDDQAASNGVNMKDMNKAFDKFNFQMPPILPFTVNIERDGDYFLVRAACEVNFLPAGPIMNALDKLDNLNYFDEQFKACMDAVNAAKPLDDDFFDDIPRFPSAFCGIKGFLSGIGHINPETGKLDINFYDGGLTFEASAKASANVSFFIGGFGMSVDAKIAMTMALVNRAAAQGDVASLPKIDFVIDNQCRLKVCAWAYGGIDIWIAKATAGVRGGACIDVNNRTVFSYSGGDHKFGTKTTLQAKMEAYAEARFLFFKAKKSWTILDAQKTWLTPNNPSNPFHPSNQEPIFAYSRKDVTKGYKKLRRKAIKDLGTPIISDVNGMAQPTYMYGGTSLLFDNMKTASDYNDDRLQLYSEGHKSNFIDTGVGAPMYNFAVDYHGVGREVVAFEQLSKPINSEALETVDTPEQIKAVSEMSEIHVAWRDKGEGDWQQTTIGSMDGSACVLPAVASSTNGMAVIWQQGKAMFNDEGERYIDGSLMLRRSWGDLWDVWGNERDEPIEILRLNRRCVPIDYQMTLAPNGDVLVVMTLKQDINNAEKSARIVYLTVDRQDNKVRMHYTQTEGSKPQMVQVTNEDGKIANLVAYLQQKEDGRDIVLTTVDTNGNPNGKVSGSLGMKNRMINDYKLVLDKDAQDLEDVALVWSQSDQEAKDNGDGTQTVEIKNRLYTSKLCSHDNQLYFSAPVEIATMPDDVSLVSMDGYLDSGNLEMKVAYCVSNEQDGAAVLEKTVEFTNAIEHEMSFNAYEVNDNKQVPVTITVANKGFEPIESIDVTMGDQTTNHQVLLMPQEATELTVYYPVTDDFDGTIDYDVAANFIRGNSNELKSRRRKVMASRPRRVMESGTQQNIRQVDMALKVLSKKTAGDKTTIVAEVNNASLLPLADDVNVKVALYDSPLATEKATHTTEVTVNKADLYDANTKQNKVKIVTLTTDLVDGERTLYLRTTPMEGSKVLTDVRPSNNVLPVNITSKYKRGDANADRNVSVTDIAVVVNDILQLGNAGGFSRYGADANGDGNITVTDIGVIVDMILGTKTSANSRKMEQVLEPQ